MQVLESWYQIPHKTLILVCISEYYFSYCYIFRPQIWVFYYGPPQFLHDSKYQLNTANTVKEKHNIFLSLMFFFPQFSTLSGDFILSSNVLITCFPHYVTQKWYLLYLNRRFIFDILYYIINLQISQFTIIKLTQFL